jgi:hypothetical protein
VLGHEPLLQWMELAVLLEPLDRHELLALGLDGEHRAGLHGPVVQENGAGAAMGRVAADVRAGQAQHVAQQVDQQEARLHVGLVLFAVDRERHPHVRLSF